MNKNDSVIYIRPWVNNSNITKYIANTANKTTLNLQLGHKNSILIPYSTLKSVLVLSSGDSLNYWLTLNKTVYENRSNIVICFDYVAYNALSEREMSDFKLIPQSDFIPISAPNIYKYPYYNRHCKWFEVKIPLPELY